MTRSTPCRRMILHFSQRFLMEARTRMATAPLSEPIRDPAPRQVVRRQLDEHTVARQDLDEVEADLPGNVREDLVAVRQLHLEHRVRQGLADDALHLNRVLFGHALLPWTSPGESIYQMSPGPSNESFRCYEPS